MEKVLPRFSWHFNRVVLTFALSRIHPVTFFWSLSLMTVSSFWPLSSCPLPTTQSHHQAMVYCMYILCSLLGNNHLLFHLPTLTCTDTNPISFSKSLEDILTKKWFLCFLCRCAYTGLSPPGTCSTWQAISLRLLNNALNKMTFYHALYCYGSNYDWGLWLECKGWEPRHIHWHRCLYYYSNGVRSC